MEVATQLDIERERTVAHGAVMARTARDDPAAYSGTPARLPGSLPILGPVPVFYQRAFSPEGLAHYEGS